MEPEGLRERKGHLGEGHNPGKRQEKKCVQGTVQSLPGMGQRMGT